MAPCDWTASWRIVGSQSFAVAMELGVPAEGDIFAGRVAASASSLPLRIAGDVPLTLDVSNPEVRFDISEERVTGGVIGGVTGVDELIRAAATASGLNEATVRPVIEGYADIRPAADPTPG